MKCTIRLAVPKDEKKIRGLFLEMLRMIYHTDDGDRLLLKKDIRRENADMMLLCCDKVSFQFAGYVNPAYYKNYQ